MIRRSINRILVIVFIVAIAFNMLSAQVVSPFNKRVLKDSLKTYSFIVSGHFHGSPASRSTFPAATLLANIDTLNELNPCFLMSLGDLFIDVNEKYISNYQKSLFTKLKMPLFNAVGNHDISNDNYYEKVYGKTYSSFILNSELYIILNTELNDGSIKGEQLIFFNNALKEANLEQIKNIFIFSHRPIWSENNEAYAGLFEGNTRTMLGENNFEDEIKPVLKSVSKGKSIYWMSGSMAGGAASFFYNKEPETGITFIQTAIRDLPRDAVLQLTIDNGKVNFTCVSFTAESLKPLESYGINFWKKNTAPEDAFSFRLLPYLTMKMLMHYYFWIGFVTSLLLLLFLRLLYSRWKRRK